MNKVKNSFFRALTIMLVMMIVFTQAILVEAKTNRNISAKKEILVKFKDDNKSEAVKDKVKDKLKLEKMNLKKKMKQSKVELLEVGANDDIDSVISELKKDDNVQYVQPNYKLTASDITDDQFVQQWGLQNNGQVVGSQAGTVGLDINTLKAWDVTKGENVVVGVLDTGIDITHPDIEGSMYVNTKEIPGNGIDDDGNGYIDDYIGWDFANNDKNVYDSTLNDTHGTEVAGIIAASLNGQGIVGVAPNVKILPLKFLSGSTGYTSDAIEAIEYAKSIGVKIINCSWGGTDYNPALKDAMQNSDILFICAAGNSSKNIDTNSVYPACFGLPNIITVGAVDNQGNLASFSNYGTKVDVAAPGVGILSATPNNNYSSISGTSAAAPFVTGVAALIKSYSADLTYDQIKSKIINDVTTLDTLAGKVSTSGLVNAFDSLEANPADIKSSDTTQNTDTTQNNTTNSDTQVDAFTLPAITQSLIDQIHYGENGVNPSTGNYSESFTDMTGATPGFTINIGRTYNSKDDRTTSLMGRGWTFGYEGSVKDDPNNTSYKVVKLGDGRAFAFYKNADGTFTANDSRNTLVKNADNTYTMTTKDLIKYTFDVNGYLTSIADRNGNTINIQVDSVGKVLKITDTVGKIYTLTYENNFIKTITDPIGRVVTYNYTSNLLTSVQDATYAYTYYSYDGSNYLTTVKNNSSVVTETIAYDHNAGDKAIKYIDELGNNQVYSYDSTNKKTTITEGNISNLVQNSSFENGLTGWNFGGGATVSVDSTITKFGTQSLKIVATNNYAECIKDIVVPNGHIIYECRWAYISAYTSGSTGGGFADYGSWNNYVGTNFNTTLLNQWQLLSTRRAAANGGIRTSYGTCNPSNLTMYYDGINVIDLTAIFGAGNEPTKEYMDELVQQGKYTNPIFINKIANSSFETDGSGWSAFGAIDNTYKKYGNNSAKYNVTNNWCSDYTYTASIGDKLYACMWVNIPSWTKGYALCELNSTNYAINNSSFARPTNGWEFKSMYGVTTQAGGNVRIGCWEQSVGNGGLFTAYYDGITLLNLTQIFGAGNEPSKAEMDSLMQLYGGYIDNYMGHQIIKTYDNYMYTTSSQDPEAKTTTVAYNLDANSVNKYGEEKTISDRNGNTTQYARDNNGNITTITNPDGSTEVYTYDDKNNLLSEKDELGRMTYYVYDTNKINLIKKVQPLNGTDVYATGADESKFAITSYIYYTDAEISQMGAKGKGLLKSVTDPEGNVTTYTYDENGNVSSVKDAQGNITQYTYNQVGWKTSEVSPKGLKTDYTYNNNGQLTKTVLDQGETITYVYDLGRKIQEVSPNQYNDGSFGDVGTRYTYYTNGKVSSIKDAQNNVTSYVYDVFGNVIKETKPNGSIYTYDYDVMNRLKRVWFKDNIASNQVQLEQYDYAILAGGKTQKTYTKYLNDTETAVTVYTYDYAGRLISQVNPDGTVVSTTYNTNGLTASTTDALGSTTVYIYDGLNRQTEAWTPFDKVNGVTRYSYIKVNYDKAGRKTSIRKSKNPVAYGATSNEAVESYVYYANGKVNTITDSQGGKSVYTYDADGNVSKEEVYTSDTNKNVTEYISNQLGKPLQKIVYVDGYDIYPNNLNSTKQIKLITKYTYDQNGNLLTIATPDKIATTYTYDNLNRQLTVSKPGKDENGTDAAITKSVVYNNMGKVYQEYDGRGNKTEYTYNPRTFLIKVSNQLTDTTNAITAYEYDRAGRKIREVSPLNYDYINNPSSLSSLSRTEYLYDLMDRVKTKSDIYKDSTNTWVTITKGYKYDSNGNVIKELDPLGYDNGTGTTADSKIYSGYGTEYTYNLVNKVITMLDPQSKQDGLDFTKKYEYDGLGRKVSETDAKGTVTLYSYDDDGNILSVKVKKSSNDKEQTIKTNSYDLVGNLLATTDGNGNTIKYEYNSLNKVRKVTYPKDASVEQNIVTYQYDVMGNATSTQNSIGTVIIYTYDNEGRILSKTEQNNKNKDAIKVSFTYDKNGNKCTETDGNGNKKVNTYDKLNRLASTAIIVTNISGVKTTQTTSYAYDANSNLLTTTDWRGNVTTNIYDPLNRLVEKKDAYNKSIQKLEYNINSVQTKSTDALGNATTYGYDLNNKLITTKDPAGHLTSKSYDEVGNISEKTDGNGNTIKYSYDQFNRLVLVTNAKGETTSYTYDLNDNMLTQTDGAGNTETFEYNAINKLLRKIDNGGRTQNDDGTFSYDSSKAESYTYYPDGNLKTSLDGNGNTTTYVYDVHGRMISKQVGSITITFAYDKNGNQVSITDGTGTTVRTYDELNRVVTKTVPNLGTSTYLYDIVVDTPEVGRTGETLKDPKGNITTKVNDKVGRLITVTADGQTTTYTYFDNGNRQSVVYPDGSKEVYTYNSDNLISTLTNYKSDGTTIVEGVAYQYTYDAAHNQTSKVDSKGTTSYTYDELNRLEIVTEPNGNVTTYNFDAAGNRTQEILKASGTITLTNYTYNDQNRLMTTVVTLADGSRETTTYKYDNNGNTIFKTNEVAKKADPAVKPKFGIFQVGVTSSGTVAVDTAIYEYDELNQLICTKTSNQTINDIYNGEGLRVAKDVNGQTTRYMYEYDKVILEVDKDGKQVARNVYGNNLISRTVDGQKLYYMYNGHADVTALLDNSGNIVATYYYDAFGNITEQTGNVNNSVTYAGYEYDKETGLYYLNARMYDPVTARFMQEDTYRGDKNDPLSLNLYTYCHNEPIMYTDPSGHLAITDKIYTAFKSVMDKLVSATLDYYKGNNSAKATAASVRGVADVQMKLAGNNYSASGSKSSKITIDGVMGSVTAGVLNYFTNTKNLPSYSKDRRDIDGNTYNAIMGVKNSPNYKAPTGSTSYIYFKQGMNSPYIEVSQYRLKELGYFNDNPTGYYGNITKQALVNFQDDNGLDSDGVIGINTFNKLFFDANVKAYVAPNIALTTYDLGKGWYARKDPTDPGAGEQEHIHVWNKKGSEGKWSQNEDGSLHKEGQNSSDSPPNTVKKKLKEKTGWDWDKNKEKQDNNGENPQPQEIVIQPTQQYTQQPQGYSWRQFGEDLQTAGTATIGTTLVEDGVTCGAGIADDIFTIPIGGLSWGVGKTISAFAR